MSEIAKRVWREPAVFIGFVTTVALVIITVVAGNDWDIATIAGCIAPLVSALGIRELVVPYIGQYEEIGDGE